MAAGRYTWAAKEVGAGRACKHATEARHVSTSAVELKEDMVYVWLLNSGKLSKTTSRHLPVDRRQVYLGS